MSVGSAVGVEVGIRVGSGVAVAGNVAVAAGVYVGLRICACDQAGPFGSELTPLLINPRADEVLPGQAAQAPTTHINVSNRIGMENFCAASPPQAESFALPEAGRETGSGTGCTIGRRMRMGCVAETSGCVADVDVAAGRGLCCTSCSCAQCRPRMARSLPGFTSRACFKYSIAARGLETAARISHGSSTCGAIDTAI